MAGISLFNVHVTVWRRFLTITRMERSPWSRVGTGWTAPEHHPYPDRRLRRPRPCDRGGSVPAWRQRDRRSQARRVRSSRTLARTKFRHSRRIVGSVIWGERLQQFGRLLCGERRRSCRAQRVWTEKSRQASYRGRQIFAAEWRASECPSSTISGSADLRCEALQPRTGRYSRQVVYRST